jgi:hypothetical protein
VRARSFFTATSGNLAMILALSAIPLTLAMGSGVDYARGLVVHSNMADALDAAGLAVGGAASKPTSCSSDGSSSGTTGNGSGNSTPCAPLQLVAQQFFNANFKQDSGADAVSKVSISIANQAVTLSVSDNVPTTFLAAADRLLSSTALDSMLVTASSTVVWGQTKLWVSLVLDNSGSMSDSDSGGSKMSALQAASHSLLTTLQNASTTAGDVEVSIVPFARGARVGTANVAAAWLYWGFWEQPGEANGATIADTTPINNTGVGMTQAVNFNYWGPGDDCPFTYGITPLTQSPFGYTCTDSPPNTASPVNKIPASGTYKGYICPGADPGTYNADRHDHFYNGCWTSTKVGASRHVINTGSTSTCNGFSSTNCKCIGSGSGKSCSTYQWTHTWVINNHSTWGGCITDRPQDYDIQDTTPAFTSIATTGMPADNPSDGTGCLAASVTPLGYNWTTLNSQITAMSPGGTTNQAIGVANGWLTMTAGDPYGAPTLPSNTNRFIIMLSDGLNTEDRWYGDGSSTGTSQTALIDTRENLTCTAAKNDSAGAITIYTLFLDLNGTQGNSAPLQNCASPGKYIDLTSTSQVATAFASIAQQITNLRVSK